MCKCFQISKEKKIKHTTYIELFISQLSFERYCYKHIKHLYQRKEEMKMCVEASLRLSVGDTVKEVWLCQSSHPVHQCIFSMVPCYSDIMRSE